MNSKIDAVVSKPLFYLSQKYFVFILNHFQTVQFFLQTFKTFWYGLHC